MNKIEVKRIDFKRCLKCGSKINSRIGSDICNNCLNGAGINKCFSKQKRGYRRI
jgi:ribosomal protein L37AE/L43A